MNRKLLCLLLVLVFAACKFSEDKRGAGSPDGADGSGSSSQSSADARGRVTVRGSDAMKGIASKLAAAYQKNHSGATVQVEGGGTSSGFAALAAGQTDVAQASRPINDAERAAVQQQRGAAPVETPVAFEAIGIYVNDANPVKQLSLRQIDGIVTGTITNWSAVGGPNAPIVVYGQGSAAGFTSYLGGAGAPPKPQRDFADSRGTIAAVAADPNGIGYSNFLPTSQARVIWVQRTDGGIAVAPAEKTVRDRSYPISGQLFFYTLANAEPRVRTFVDWIKSNEAKKVLESEGYVVAAGK